MPCCFRQLSWRPQALGHIIPVSAPTSPRPLPPLLCVFPSVPLLRTLVMAFRAYLGNPGLSHLKNLNHICKDPVFNKVAFTGSRGLTWLYFRATKKPTTCLESYSLSVTKLGLVPLPQGSCPHPPKVFSALVGLLVLTC